MQQNKKDIIHKLADFLLELEIDGQKMLNPEQIAYFQAFKTDVENVHSEDDQDAIITALAQTIQKISDDTDILSRKISGYNRAFLEKIERYKENHDIESLLYAL